MIALFLACAAPDPSAAFTTLSVEATDADGVSAAFVAAIDGATESVHVALPGGDDVDVADALIDAWEAGLDVQVITDVDLAEAPAVSSLVASEVPTALADGGMAYFDFALNVDVAWTSDQVRMTHAWAVADRKTLVASTRAGDFGAGSRVLLRARGEELVEDVLSEHNQVFGGTDATATTAYSGLAKSIADDRWVYPTEDEVVPEVWFGPQERLTKRIIDDVYAARSSVWVLTDDLANDGLARALQEKASWGFDVQVVVGTHFGDTSSLLSDVLLDDAPDVDKRRLTDRDVVPTLVIVDAEPASDGFRYPTRAHLLSHDLYSSSRLYRAQEVVTDQLLDGTLWTLVDRRGESADVAALIALWKDHLDASEAL